MNREREEQSSAANMIGRLAIRIMLTALAVLAVYVAAKYAYDFGRDIFYQIPAESAPGHDITLEISDDSDLPKVLFENGLIRNEKAFSVMTAFYKPDPVPGEYTLNTSMTTKELITRIMEQSAVLLEEEEAGKESAPDENVVGGGDEEG